MLTTVFTGVVMRDTYLQEAMRVVLDKLGLEPDTPYSIEPVRANLWLSAAYRIRVETSSEHIHSYV